VLLDADPETASYTDQNRRSPLHWACDVGGASAGVIELLLRHNPESASMKEETFGFLPLHIACYKEICDRRRTQAFTQDYDDEQNDVVRTLLNWHPDAALTPDTRGWLPLHIACRTGVSETVIKSLISAQPSSIHHSDFQERLPIHLACCCPDINTGVISTLIREDSACLQRKETKYGFLPLHVACSKPRVNHDLVDLLLREFPMGARVPDRSGSLALHLACRAGVSRSVIRILIDVFGEGAGHKDGMGRLPIHWACHSGSSRRTIQALLDAYPQGARIIEEKYEYLPLHVACLRGASDGAIHALLNSYPEAIKMKDRNGDLPVHIACENGTCANVVNMLVSHNSESVNEKNAKDNMLVPHHSESVRRINKYIKNFNEKKKNTKTTNLPMSQ